MSQRQMRKVRRDESFPTPAVQPDAIVTTKPTGPRRRQAKKKVPAATVPQQITESTAILGLTELRPAPTGQESWHWNPAGYEQRRV